VNLDGVALAGVMSHLFLLGVAPTSLSGVSHLLTPLILLSTAALIYGPASLLSQSDGACVITETDPSSTSNLDLFLLYSKISFSLIFTYLYTSIISFSSLYSSIISLYDLLTPAFFFSIGFGASKASSLSGESYLLSILLL
jgi:hypothetical protein